MFERGLEIDAMLSPTGLRKLGQTVGARGIS